MRCSGLFPGVCSRQHAYLRKPLKKKREYRHPGWTHEEACML
nr:MAG TPA: hypothetical protein [Caudoviricetes sp.]